MGYEVDQGKARWGLKKRFFTFVTCKKEAGEKEEEERRRGLSAQREAKAEPLFAHFVAKRVGWIKTVC
jgi:hypothetical protein